MYWHTVLIFENVNIAVVEVDVGVVVVFTTLMINTEIMKIGGLGCDRGDIWELMAHFFLEDTEFSNPLAKGLLDGHPVRRLNKVE